MMKVFLTALMGCVSSAGQDVYVATSGNDANPGTETRPFATLDRARDAIREVKRAGRIPAGGITVHIRGGTYLLQSPLVLEPRDSGTLDSPIVYSAYQGEKPVLVGGVRISGWKRPAGSGKIWQAAVPAGWRFQRLYWNGRALPRSSTPNGDNWEEWPRAKPGATDREIVVPPELVRTWTDLSQLELNVLPTLYTYWKNRILPVAGADGRTGVIKFGQRVSPSDLRLPDQIPFRVENTIQGIDQPGEWALDSHSGRLFLWPLEGGDPNGSEVIAPKLTEAIAIRGDEQRGQFVRAIELRGLEVAYVNGAGIDVEAAENCTIRDSKVSNTSGNGIQIRLYARNVQVLSSEISHVGSTGISISGYPPGTHHVNRGHMIADNHVHHCGEMDWQGVGISVGGAGYLTVAHNLVHDLPYAGITVGGTKLRTFRSRWGNARWNEIGEGPFTVENVKRFAPGHVVVEKNIVHDFNRMLDDGGAIYFHASHHNVIRNNLIYRGRRDYSYGIYLDDEEIDTSVEDNIVLECPKLAAAEPQKGAALLLHDNPRNTVRNNIFADSSRLFRFPNSYGGHTIVRNLFVFGKRSLFDETRDPAAVPGPGDGRRQVDWDAGASIMDYNLYWTMGDRGELDTALERWRKRGWDRNSVVADPQIRLDDPLHLDALVQGGPAAHKLGFRAIDTSDLGPRQNRSGFLKLSEGVRQGR